MKITFKNLAIATSLCSALVLSPLSYAGSDKSDTAKHQQMGEQRFAKMAKKLELTETQQADLKAIKQEEKIQKEAYKPAIEAYHTQMKAIASAEVFDEQAFIQLQASNQDVFAALALIKAKNKFAMKTILTPEQLVKFKKMQKKMKGHKGDHKGNKGKKGKKEKNKAQTTETN